MIKFLLLLSLLFNITHASFMAVEDDCHHESVHEYVMEQLETDECGDLCDMHHLFHFMAILNTSTVHIGSTFQTEILNIKTTRYTPPFKRPSIKPPIV